MGSHHASASLGLINGSLYVFVSEIAALLVLVCLFGV